MALIVTNYSSLSSTQGRAVPSGVTFGIPVVEREGVPQRRMAFAYPFTPEDLDWAMTNLPPTITVYEGLALPGDWRYPDFFP